MKKRVLLVDDSQEYLDTVSGLLSNAGYQVETANCPFGVACTFMRFKPHVLLMDVNMPGLNPCRFIELLTSRKYDFDYGIVVHSPSDGEALRQVACLEGVSGYIRKDASPEEILHTLRNHMDKVLIDGITRVIIPQEAGTAGDELTGITQ